MQNSIALPGLDWSKPDIQILRGQLNLQCRILAQLLNEALPISFDFGFTSFPLMTDPTPNKHNESY